MLDAAAVDLEEHLAALVDLDVGAAARGARGVRAGERVPHRRADDAGAREALDLLERVDGVAGVGAEGGVAVEQQVVQPVQAALEEAHGGAARARRERRGGDGDAALAGAELRVAGVGLHAHAGAAAARAGGARAQPEAAVPAASGTLTVPAAAGTSRPLSAIRPPGRRVPPQRAVIRGTTVSATGCEAAATVWATSWPGSVVFAVRANVPSARVVPAAICLRRPARRGHGHLDRLRGGRA